MKKKADNSTLLTAGVIAILIVIFVVGFIWGLNNVLAMEGQYPPVVNEEGITPVPDSAEDALKLLNLSLDKAIAEKPKTETSSGFGIDGDTIKTEGSDQFKASLDYIKDNVCSYLEDSVDKPSSDFFKDNSKFIVFPDFSASDVTDFKCEYQYYQCPSCNEESAEYLDHCELCGSDGEYNLKYRDKYSITLDINCDNDKIPECFNARTSEECSAIIDDAIKGTVSIKNLDFNYDKLTVYFEVDRLKDEITYLRFSKDAKVTTDVSFVNDWDKFSGGNVNFNICENFSYSFTWPELELSDSYMTVVPKGSDNLLATLICDDATKYEVKWTSSDEEIVTVDEEGYFNAGKKIGKAIITASFEFGGKTYSDKCEVEVKVPVEGLKINLKKVTLNPGDTRQLTVKVSPKKATIQTLTWYTSDEKIATVDENGTIHAVSSGNTTVYCLSDDGYYKSSCEVTVK